MLKANKNLKNSNHSEKQLIEGIKKGNEQLLHIVYKANFTSIALFIMNNNGTETEAKDIYQEAIIIFYEKINNPEFELHCQIKTFLYSICRRLWLKRLAEKNKFAGEVQDFESFISMDKEETEMDENEKRFETMYQALGKLGEPCKTILEDFYIYRKNMQEITKKMGYTNTANAKNQKYKCLQRLKKLFFIQYNH